MSEHEPVKSVMLHFPIMFSILSSYFDFKVQCDPRSSAAAAKDTRCGDQVDSTLAAEQKKTDFRPKGGGATGAEAGRPTGAALLATALLRAIAAAAPAHLHGPNLASFLGQVPLAPPPPPS